MGLYTHQQHGIEECTVLIYMINTCIYMVVIYMILTYLKKKKNSCVYICDWIIKSSYYSPPSSINWQSSPDKKKNTNKQQHDLLETRRSDDGLCNNCRIKSSSSSSSYMYIFISLIDHQGFVLYRIDPLYHLQHKSCGLNNLRDLSPLLFFPSNDTMMEAGLINCIKLESKLYFFGLDYYFAPSNSTTTSSNVYTFEEKDFFGINPSEDNNIHNFQHLFTKTKNPMHGPKYRPTLFVANDKLYALSADYRSEYTFEVFSPFDETWQRLPFPFNKSIGSLSFLVLEDKEQMVYFGAANAVLSFNLKKHKWTTPPHYRDTCPYDDDTPHPPTFLAKPVSIIGDMAFGFRNHPSILNGYYVCASHTTSRGEELMQPNLAPDQAFLEVLRSSRFTCMDEHHTSYSDSLVALQDLDGKHVLCIVTYGVKPPDETNLNSRTRTGYVALSFFDIPGDFYTLEDIPVQEYNVKADVSYADQKAEDGSVVRRYFGAQFRHTAHFIINNSCLCTHGQLEACFI